MMKKIFSLALFAAATLAVMASPYKYNPSDIVISDLDVSKSADSKNLYVSMNVDATAVDMQSNQELILTPVIVAPGHEKSMEPMVVAGRNRIIYHLRNNEMTKLIEHNGKDAKFQYQANVPFEDWMKQSTLRLDYRIGGCSNCGEKSYPASDLAYIDMVPRVFEAEYVYIPPKAETVKTRKEVGTAYIDFPAGKSVINADFRNNSRELAKIAQTINNIKGDKDITMTGMSIKGYASPDGSYSLNARLAEARTIALKDYVQNLYSFKKDFIKTSSDPEDWTGLKAWVEKSDLVNKAGILDIINSDLEPDAKDARIKKDYPTDYAFLLKNVYPTLRHSDYVVNYTVRSYSDVAEIIRVMKTEPQKLSQNELYAAAQTMKPGTPEFNQVFDIAVTMYPDDPVANLNAANAAMQRGDMASAGKYLKKAGNTPQAEYARGIFAAYKKDYSTAANILSKINLPQAKAALKSVKAVQAGPEKPVRLAK